MFAAWVILEKGLYWQIGNHEKISIWHDVCLHVSALIWDIQMLSRSLHACVFKFIPRSGNKVAHILANDTTLGSDDCYWVEEVPAVAQATVVEDRRLVDPP
ncbi:hypothetical protein V6N12_031099 [Hibiscus sabdariffa]|uniref:RNase H type-1 domain-containing protein n=1 Tax=Hibiscus sabdariffa TaxID=183260 RepID=A0ABR2E7Y4_9ROSI